MVQGTGSGVGKSLIAAGLLRILSDMGVRCAPFKAQNMALNSFITRDGGEIGRAQALQAEAARVEPATDMNPVLLKATGEAGCQVIVDGRVHGNMTAKAYYAFKETVWESARAAYERLASAYDVIVMEGAGSPAEINLLDKDIVNMRMARHAGAGVILAGDIDRGGVFASLYGTVSLLDDYKGLIKAFLINKFRGDADILMPGIKMLEDKTGIPCLGVLPYLATGLSEEDSLALESQRLLYNGRGLKAVVIRNQFISNFDDFDPFLHEPDVELVYSLRPSEILSADLIIIPGSKNTVKDLLYLRETGAEESIRKAANKGVKLIGVCGGYQMLGSVVKDPYRVESEHGEVRGLGLLPVETVMDRTKVTTQVEGKAVNGPSGLLRGYEIHIGRTSGDLNLFSLKRLATGEDVLDGQALGNVMGTYVHGLFDNDALRGRLLNGLRARAGLPELEPVSYSEIKQKNLDRFAGVLKENLNLNFIKKFLDIAP